MNRTIYITWKRRRLPRLLKRCVQSFVTNNPGWRVCFFDDKQCENFVQREYPAFYPTYISYPAGILRADIFRVLVLYRYGGVYADIDMECLQPLQGMLDTFDENAWEVLLSTDHPIHERMYADGRTMWMNNFIVAKPKAYFLACLIEAFAKAPRKDKIAELAVSVTGPALFSRTIEVEGGLEKLRITQLPWQWVNPLPDMAQDFPERAIYDRQIRQRTWQEEHAPFLVHYWHHTWCQAGTTLEQYLPFLQQSDGEIAERRLQAFCSLMDKRVATTGRAIAEFAERGGGRLVELGIVRQLVHENTICGHNQDSRLCHPDRPEEWNWTDGCFTKLVAEILQSLNMQYIGVDPDPDAHEAARNAVIETKCIDFESSCSKPFALESAEFCTLIKPTTSMEFRKTRSTDFLKCEREQIALLYMDYGELSEECARLHAQDIQLVLDRDLIAPGGMILIDDHQTQAPYVPLSKYSVPLLVRAGYKVLEEGQQILLEKSTAPRASIPKIIHLFASDSAETEFTTCVASLRLRSTILGLGWSLEEWSPDRVNQWMSDVDDAEMADTYFGLNNRYAQRRFARYAIATKIGGLVLSGAISIPPYLDELLQDREIVFFGRNDWSDAVLRHPDGLLHYAFASVPGHPFWSGLAKDVLMAYVPEDSQSLAAEFITGRVTSCSRFLPGVYCPGAIWEPAFIDSTEIARAPNISVGPRLPRVHPDDIEYGRCVGVEHGLAKRKVIAYTIGPNVGIGSQLDPNIVAMQVLDMDVEHRLWSGYTKANSQNTRHDVITYYHWQPNSQMQDSDVLPGEIVSGPQIVFCTCEVLDHLSVALARIAPFIEEIWVPSAICAHNFRYLGRPIRVVPRSATVKDGPLGQLPYQRELRPFNVLCMVDAENRNNMAGVIGAFRRVFAARCDVTLTIKTNSLSDADIATSARLCARDGRIEISSNSTHEADVDEIFHAADVFLSLLKCDWYEQNITRAMSYTIPVITNNCAGHLELCNADTAFIVPSRIAQLADSRGGPHDYRIWLEPDIEAAMDLVRDVERMINAGNEELDNRRRLAKLAVGHMLGFRTLVKNVAEALGSPQFARSK